MERSDCLAVSKEKNGRWRVIYRYTTWQGERKQTSKRGFETKREALAWEREQLQQVQSTMDMSFESFVAIYQRDMSQRLREHTWQTKNNIISTKLLPYFGQKRMNQIKASDIIAWQNQIMNEKNKQGKDYAPSYLKTMHTQLSAIFNHAVRYYELPSNPAAKAGSMGKDQTEEMLFWTKEEYLSFSDAMMDKPISFYGFEMLYWCGLRIGELLALTPADFDFELKLVNIDKSYQRIHQKDVITDPKTTESKRTVSMPQFLCDEMQEYFNLHYGYAKDARIFPYTKHYFHNEMTRGCKATGVKRIRVHDLRHSHVSLLIEMGLSALEIANRVGHKSIEITYKYAHLFPSKKSEIADKLDVERNI